MERKKVLEFIFFSFSFFFSFFHIFFDSSWLHTVQLGKVVHSWAHRIRWRWSLRDCSVRQTASQSVPRSDSTFFSTASNGQISSLAAFLFHPFFFCFFFSFLPPFSAVSAVALWMINLSVAAPPPHLTVKCPALTTVTNLSIASLSVFYVASQPKSAAAVAADWLQLSVWICI